MLRSRLGTFVRNDISKIQLINLTNLLHTSSCHEFKRLTKRRDDKSCDIPKIAIVRMQTKKYIGYALSHSDVTTTTMFSRRPEPETVNVSLYIAILQENVSEILSGCGNLDGTEISECMSATFHICEKGMIPKFYAPDMDICEVIDHYTKEPDCNSPPRNALVESARLSRFSIQPLCECEACHHAGLVLPGGFGAVRTLSDFASKGCDCTVIPDLEKLIQDFSCGKKPIGAICITSVLLARVLQGVKITLGKDCSQDDWPYAEAISIAKQMGAKVEMKDVKGVTRCKKYNVFSTPAWMYKRGTYAEINAGIGKLITMLKKCIRQ